MLYIGLDVHEEFCQACVIDGSGRALSNERFSSTSEELDRFLSGFQDAKSVMESTGIWESIYEGIERGGFEAVLAHPLKMRAIAEVRVKTDRVDAETLAQLLVGGLHPEVLDSAEGRTQSPAEVINSHQDNADKYGRYFVTVFYQDSIRDRKGLVNIGPAELVTFQPPLTLPSLGTVPI